MTPSSILNLCLQSINPGTWGEGGGGGYRIIGKFAVSLSTLKRMLCSTNLVEGP